jgi:hypothetical protein
MKTLFNHIMCFYVDCLQRLGIRLCTSVNAPLLGYGGHLR